MILAVDPGLNGALCFYAPKLGRMELVRMPTTKARIGKVDRIVIDEAGVFAAVTAFAAEGATLLFIEQVQGLPKQSAPAAFNFGLGYGALRMAGIANGMAIEVVPPSTWKAAMQVSADKDEARERASFLVPTHKHLFTRKKDDGLAEAALLALYAQRRIDGEPFTKRDREKVAKARDARDEIEAERQRKLAANRARRQGVADDIDPESLF